MFQGGRAAEQRDDGGRPAVLVVDVDPEDGQKRDADVAVAAAGAGGGHDEGAGRYISPHKIYEFAPRDDRDDGSSMPFSPDGGGPAGGGGMEE